MCYFAGGKFPCHCLLFIELFRFPIHCKHPNRTVLLLALCPSLFCQLPIDPVSDHRLRSLTRSYFSILVGNEEISICEKSPFHRHKFNVQINPRRYLAIIFGLVCIYGAFMLFLAYRVAYVISPGKCVLSNEKNSKVNFMK